MTIDQFKHWALFSAPILLVLFGLWLGLGTEEAVANYFKAHNESHPTLKMVMKFITDWSNVVFYVIYAAMLFMAFKNRDGETKRFVFVLLCVQLVVGVLAVHFTKHVIGRPRPGEGWYFDPLTTRGNYHSLPSGHTTEFTGWSLPLAFRLNRYWVSGVFGLFVALVGFTRIYLNWHHPSDVFFGWMLGSFGGFVTIIIHQSSLFRKKTSA